jgi:8-oxo-dGTP pyrophosphatase MutT (NUDIX family)
MKEEFFKSLEQLLKKELPGAEAHQKLAPLNRDLRNNLNNKTPGFKQGSVLILLYPANGEIFLPLMQRPNYQGIHSGQISFPGGKKEEIDSDLIATALRETMEEIGVLEKDVKVVGTLTELYIPASNFKVLPVVGYVTKQPNFIPDQYEVVKIIETSVSELLDEGIIKTRMIKTSLGLEIKAPYYDVQGHIVWGATAMILSEFLDIVKRLTEEKDYDT